MVHGRFLGRQSNTSSENSEKSTSYSVRMPSVSGSISPAWPRVLASWLVEVTRRKTSWLSVVSHMTLHFHIPTLTPLQSCCRLPSRWSDIWTRCWCSRLLVSWSLRDSQQEGCWSAAPGGPQGRTRRRAYRVGTSGNLLQLWSVSSQQCTQPEERLKKEKITRE